MLNHTPRGNEMTLYLYLAFVVHLIITILLMWIVIDYLQISFQEFKNKLLEPGLVDHIVVSNKSVAKIYVRNSPRDQTDSEVFQGNLPAKGSGGQYKYLINIGSVESFEEKLEEVQEALGVDPHDFVPVTYSSEMVWYQELMRFAPTLLLLGTLLYMGRRMQGGFGVGGGTGGKGGRGIFNIGKAHVHKVDKNAKHKVGNLFFYK
jgi:AFG3 family protein